MDCCQRFVFPSGLVWFEPQLVSAIDWYAHAVLKHVETCRPHCLGFGSPADRWMVPLVPSSAKFSIALCSPHVAQGCNLLGWWRLAATSLGICTFGTNIVSQQHSCSFGEGVHNSCLANLVQCQCMDVEMERERERVRERERGGRAGHIFVGYTFKDDNHHMICM